MQTNNAKFTFYYLLSLVSLVFMSLGTGMILFQIINSLVPDIAGRLFQGYNDGTIRFGIAALFVSAPVYFFTTAAINRNVISGELPKDGPARKWLTYFIFFVSSVTVLGWIIGTINMFLGGELTVKFALKLFTVILIAGGVFGFYLYDIRRQSFVKKDKGIRAFFWSALAVVAGTFIASFFFADSPSLVRARKIDNMTASELNSLQMAVNEYYDKFKKLPDNLESLSKEAYVQADGLNDFNGHPYGYKIIDASHYELCAEFLADSQKENRRDADAYSYAYPQKEWEHKVGGDNCFQREATSNKAVETKF